MIEHLGKFFFFSLKLRTFSPPKNSQSKLKLACFKHEKMHDFVLGLNPFVTRTYQALTLPVFFFSLTKIFTSRFKYRTFSIYLPLVKNFNSTLGFVGNWLRNGPLQQLWFFSPSFWRTKTPFVIRCKRLGPLDYHMTLANDKIPTFYFNFIFKIILTWEIKALK